MLYDDFGKPLNRPHSERKEPKTAPGLTERDWPQALAGVSRACGAVSEWRSWEGVCGYVWVCVGVLCGCVMCVLEDGLGIRVCRESGTKVGRV